MTSEKIRPKISYNERQSKATIQTQETRLFAINLGFSLFLQYLWISSHFHGDFYQVIFKTSGEITNFILYGVLPFILISYFFEKNYPLKIILMSMNLIVCFLPWFSCISMLESPFQPLPILFLSYSVPMVSIVFSLHVYTLSMHSLLKLSVAIYSNDLDNTENTLILLFSLLLDVICIFNSVFKMYLLSDHEKLGLALQKAIRDTEKALEREKMTQSSLKNFTAYLFHEVRIPMNAIVFGIDNLKLMISDMAKDDPQWVTFCTTIDDLEISANRSKLILNQVLDLNSLEQGAFKISMEEFDLAEKAKEVMRMMHPIAFNKKIDVELELQGIALEGERFMALWDGIRYQEILSNLLSNALKHTPMGKSIKVTIESLPLDPEKDPAVSYIETKIVTKVADTGAGISPENLNKLFTPYTLLHKSNEISSSGLGLVICKKILQLADGKIYASSELGVGSTFIFEIPLKARIWSAKLHQMAAQTFEEQASPIINPNSNSSNSNMDNSSASIESRYTGSYKSPSTSFALLQSANVFRISEVSKIELFQRELNDDLRKRERSHLASAYLNRRRSFGGENRRRSSSSSSHHAQLSGRRSSSPESKLGGSILLGTQITALNEGMNSSKSLSRASGEGLRLRSSGSASTDESHDSLSEILNSPNMIPRSGSMLPSLVFNQEIQKEVLVAEDDAINYRLIQARLTRLGIKACHAMNGREVIEILKSNESAVNRFSMILMDQNMPEMSGIDAVKIIRNEMHMKDIPIVGISGGTMEEQEQFKAAGLDETLLKPLNLQELDDLFEKYKILQKKK